MNAERVDRLTLRLFATAAALSPFVIDYRFWPTYFHDYADLTKTLFLQLATAAFAALFFLRAARGPDRRFKIPFFAPPLAAFLLWAALSLSWAVNPREGARVLTHWTACAAAGLLLFQWIEDAADARFWLDALACSAAAVSLLGVLQAFGVPVASWVPQTLAPAATFGHRNMAVQFLALAAPAAGVFWFYETNENRRRAYAAALAAIAAYLLLAASRAGLLVLVGESAAAVALILLFDKTRPHFDRSRAASLAAAAAVVLLCLLTRPAPENKRTGDLLTRVVTTAREGTRESNLRLRLVFWRNSLEMIADHPLRGVGLDNHKIHYPRYSRTVMSEAVLNERNQIGNLHNDYLQILAETGLVGFGLALWLVLLVVLRLRESGSSPVSIALAVGFFGFALDAVVSFPLFKPLPPFLLAAQLGILAALGPAREFRLGRAAAAVLTALAALTLVFCARSVYTRGAAEAAYTKAMIADLQERWDDSAKHAAAARRLDGSRDDILFLLGKGLTYSGRPSEAIEPLSRLVAAQPNYINGILVLGDAYASTGKMQDALALYKRCLEIQPDYARAYHGMGELFLKAGKRTIAFEAMKEAARLAPEITKFQIHLGQIAAAQGDRDTARAAFQAALETAPAEDRPFIRKELAALGG
ncbi:MAG: hypothetical protein CO113_15450 [Elusimicrobia bacterium CG_4_9_14_3_um_filter_62_55]|nr:MAG: hypothetical protein COR54_06515 [Elusimicrobia bacterium CG22_combo_CG10-13_8_21_14_all_63_91]PJA15123.1 MAG: hypothetical protein COX66_10860 [Elusimicrobia bacterium CG_4_10_14_0_2_um_filter_63_34]PJB24145.1 MAG: hypothetical protein CO113_15450 [Elusimicrobia bacterium CG_4_9_14_3_um_filter_62_55]